MPERESLDLFEALHSTRAMRYLKPDPIADEVLWEILDAAIRGPTGGNQQGWSWIVVRDAEVKQQIAAWYLEGWERAYGQRRDEILADDSESGLGRVNFLSAEHLANNLADAPVWVFPVLHGGGRVGSSIYGAVQNLMLAARAYGIGSTLTSLYAGHEDDVSELLGLPEGAQTMALIPLG